jgi:hypothetical protein
MERSGAAKPGKLKEEVRYAEGQLGSPDPPPSSAPCLRPEGMRCKSCIWFAGSPAEGERIIHVGRCCRHAPTTDGFPVVYVNDWCGDHSVNEHWLSQEGGVLDAYFPGRDVSNG